MDRFLTVDLNGWLDHLVVGSEDGLIQKPITLGFRSCLFQHQDTWLLGGQALAAARATRTGESLISAIDALGYAAGTEDRPTERRHILPDALWQLVSDISKRSDDPIHLAVVVADSRYLGSPKINPETGRTQLETLYDSFWQRRPRHLHQSRLELIWRSVATLHSAKEKAKDTLGSALGSVLVISANRKVFWTTLRLVRWPPGSQAGDMVHIARRAGMNECHENESYMTQQKNFVESNLAGPAYQNIYALKKWTRSIEILSTGMSSKSLAEFGVNVDALEHWSWPIPNRDWKSLHQKPIMPKECPSPVLPKQLDEDIRAFTTGQNAPLAIVVESPLGIETTSRFARAVRDHAVKVPVIEITGWDTSEAAMDLALTLGRDSNAPAWLDEVPSIELETRPEPANGETGAKWIPIVDQGRAIPAGETYHTPSGIEERTVTLAPGIEHVLLHLRRGYESNWDERYTRHTIAPNDHERIVEPLARVRPLSGDARIEIEERLPSGKRHLLTSVRWNELEKTSPPELGSIPELYIFKSDRNSWRELRSLLERVIRLGESNIGLRDEIYDTATRQWKASIFPLGSDGLPPEPEESDLLTRSTRILLRDLENYVRSGTTLKCRIANRLHTPLTWLFTGCPEKTVEILLRAAVNPKGLEGTALRIEDNEYSAWSIYSGIGRAIRGDDALRIVFDDLLGVWERKGGAAQDKYLLAAVTHPLARRVSVRFILGESKERFDRVARFLKQQLNNLIMGNHDPRPDGKRPNLEFRYITMGYRGLCQIRYLHQDWFSHAGEDAKLAYKNLCEAKGKIRGTFEKNLVERTAPYLIGKGEDPAMPSGF